MNLLVALGAACVVADSPIPGLDIGLLGLSGYHISAPVVEQMKPSTIKAYGGVTIIRGPFVLQADEVNGDYLTGDWSALGNVHLQQPGSHLTADSLTYNDRSKTGVLQNASGKYGNYFFKGESIALQPGNIVKITMASTTTCDIEKPHWSLGAKSITLHNGKFAVARDISFRIKDNRWLAFPSLRLNLKKSKNELLPSPGYDSRDGLYLKLKYPVSAGYDTAGEFSGRLAWKNGILGTVEFQRETLHNEDTPEVARGVPQDLNDIGLIRSSELDRYAAPPPSGQSSEVDASRISGKVFIRLAYKERVYDPEVRDVSLDRFPEVGYRLLDIPLLKLSPGRRSPGYLDAQASFGRFREYGDKKWHHRYDAKMIARFSRASAGNQWLWEPTLFSRFSAYSTGQHQSVYGATFSIGRRITPIYFGSVLYVRHWTDGASPFQFDDIDIKEKLATRLEAIWRDSSASLVIDYDLNQGGVYDWSLEARKLFHCIEPEIRYQNRYKNITLNLNFVAMLH